MILACVNFRYLFVQVLGTHYPQEVHLIISHMYTGDVCANSLIYISKAI